MRKELIRVINLSFLNSLRSIVFAYCLFIFPLNSKSQIANYVSNGGFEEILDCSFPPHLNKVKYWRSIDSVSWTPFVFSSCIGIGTSPSNPSGFQYPKAGNSYCGLTVYCDTTLTCIGNSSRLYARNRLKQNLQQGKTYCVKFYVNVVNASTYGSDGFAACFVDNSIDTITQTGIPLNYLVSQVSNSNGNVIVDTLNWIPITGTFVATGNERHVLIGNFKYNASTTTTLINSNQLPSIFTDAYLDDVSCIDMDLPAYAGPDLYVVPGSSVYIGRQLDVGIDEVCKWYKLPNTTTAIDTAAGLWVSPVSTSTYVVVQDICGNIKSDTVIVWSSGLGLVSSSVVENDIKIFPNPASYQIQIQYRLDLDQAFNQVFIYNNLGQLIREEEIAYKNKNAILSTSNLHNGVYSLELKNNEGQSIKKRFVISR